MNIKYVILYFCFLIIILTSFENASSFNSSHKVILLSQSTSDCALVQSQCANECDPSIYNYDSGSYLNSSDTDFQSNCVQSCNDGATQCLESGCSNFTMACINSCPSTVYSYKDSQYLYNTDANSKCEDACNVALPFCQ